ncbi:MAG: RluA family pseudouridine synthase [Clostridia bacterium]|nr:RluA family pseudouridine synthase [Clostridia bacterium]
MGGSFVFRAITRLDRDTSGVVLIAKNQLAAANLGREITKGAMEKRYHARVTGIPEPREGEIFAPIAREREDSLRRVVREDGKDSLTRYRVLSVDGEGNALCEVMPITGRTHQIRVHMAHIGHPLKDDFLYGEQNEGKIYFLRCVSLTFTHPFSGECMTVTVEKNERSLSDF